jgi:GntR family transcriptional regulator/MocR family aminotransferase
MEISVDRERPVPLVEQISSSLKSAILEGRLEPGARLPSWLDMATQLGVARGTVKAAYEKLADEFLVVSAGAGGTRVAHGGTELREPAKVHIRRPLEGFQRGYYLMPLPFQMGVPAHDAFPAKLWARLRTRAVRDDAMVPVGQPDPRGNPELRSQIASYLAIARGIRCMPDQIILTGGYRNGLALAVRTLGAQRQTVWMEDPGYPITRMGLQLDGMTLVPVPVDQDGIIVERGIELAPGATLAVVTPGHQAPTGALLSPERRRALLQWASDSGAWIIEDDYLSEFQLAGRALPALAAQDVAERVIYIGSFGKTLSPALGLGFVVAPLSLAERFGEVAACLQPAPNTTTQLALATFIADGHYLRHLRHMKRLYTERRTSLLSCLKDDFEVEAQTGLAVIVRLPEGIDDRAIARMALQQNIAPMPLSPWWHSKESAQRGLLLGITNLKDGVTEKACQTLRKVIHSVNG